MVLCSEVAADNSLLSGWFLGFSGWHQRPPAFFWMVPWFLWLEPAASSLLPGWFLGSSGWCQRPPVFYLDGSLVLKVGASSHQPFINRIVPLPWFFRLEPTTFSLNLDGSSVLKVRASSLQPFTWIVPWFLRLSQQPPAFYLDGSLVLKVGASSL
jgi:hypothetical protein